MALNIKKIVPTRLKPKAHALRTGVLDAADRLKKHDADCPPRPLQRLVGDGDFRSVGEEMLKQIRRTTGLQPDESVLDVGCGIGRIAMPLTRYMNAAGSYEGFDIMPQAIEWCRAQITPKHPNFRFQVADIYSAHYNPGGSAQAADFVFPYADDSFDVVFLTSIFTHMLPQDVEHYLCEIARVLTPQGRAMFTVFLLSPSSAEAIDSNNAHISANHEINGARVADPNSPEAVVVLDETFFLSACARAAFEVEVSYGCWSNTVESVHGQDIVSAKKT